MKVLLTKESKIFYVLFNKQRRCCVVVLMGVSVYRLCNDNR
jgi:hypothetical protein